MKATDTILIHKQNYIDIIKNKIIENAEEHKLTYPNAAVRVCLKWLGYQLEDINFIDNKDSGIDAWYLTEGGINIFQIKTHELTSEGLINLARFDNSGVNDLTRAKNLLCSYNIKSNISNQIKSLLNQWSSLLRNNKEQEFQSSTLVTLNLIVLGEGLTPEAQSEFDRFQKINENPVDIKNMDVRFDAVLYNIDSIVKFQWEEKNREWENISGKKKTSIKLKPIKESEWINDNKNAIFYCSAINLVHAYQDLGYKIFEPNVRAEIKRSRVNESIRESIRHSKSRKEFRFLNNGITITCKSYDPPKEKGARKEFIVHYPGIVNGLQTVVALNNAYNEIKNSQIDKEDFKKNCSVLVRLLTKHAVANITDVVRATNNQNPMKPRNLMSNSPEQIGFSKLFAMQLSWFYEAKEGAWNAYEENPKNWRPYLNKNKNYFKYNKKKIRKVDNLEIAQTWLSFVGCSSTAAEERQHLFENHYELIFKKRTNKHGYDFNYSPSAANSINHSEECAPDVNLMLISYLSYTLAKSVVPSPKENRKLCIERLGEDINKKLNIKDYKEINTIELDGIMFEKDNAFALNNVLRYMPFLFTDFVGFILFKSLGKTIHNHGQIIISNYSFNSLKEKYAPEIIKNNIENRKFNENDLLIILWLIFYDKIEDWINSEWKQRYRNADRKLRFVLSKETRNKLYNEIIEIDKFMQKRILTKTWAIGVKDNQGLFEFIKECVFKNSSID
jgi:hypothetical protein